MGLFGNIKLQRYKAFPEKCEAVFGQETRPTKEARALFRCNRSAKGSSRKLIRAFLLLPILSINIFPFGSIYAQNSNQEELKRLEKEQQTHENRAQSLDKQANNAQNEINALNQKLIEAGNKQREAELIAEQSEKKLIDLRNIERAASLQFETRKDALEEVIVALIAVEKDRPPALAISPDNATEAARVAILMGLIAPQLNAKAAMISQEIGKVRQVRQDLLMGNANYKQATENLENARKTTAILIAQRRELIAKLNQASGVERQIISDIAQKASSLRDLIAKLGQALPQMASNLSEEPSFAHGFANWRGKLMPPSNGIIVQKYGDNLAEGGKATGITIRTRDSAQVLAPFDGKVEFAAPFRTYGRVLIINVGDKYRIILAGMGANYVEAGQEILAGEPIGQMSQDKNIVPDLYMEIRHENDTLNPSEWLNISKGG